MIIERSACQGYNVMEKCKVEGTGGMIGGGEGVGELGRAFRDSHKENMCRTRTWCFSESKVAYHFESRQQASERRVCYVRWG